MLNTRWPGDVPPLKRLFGMKLKTVYLKKQVYNYAHWIAGGGWWGRGDMDGGILGMIQAWPATCMVVLYQIGLLLRGGVNRCHAQALSSRGCDVGGWKGESGLLNNTENHGLGDRAQDLERTKEPGSSSPWLTIDWEQGGGSSSIHSLICQTCAKHVHCAKTLGLTVLRTQP